VLVEDVEGSVADMLPVLVAGALVAATGHAAVIRTASEAVCNLVFPIVAAAGLVLIW
jgi:hypothetical protein